MKRILASVGIGNASVDTVLPSSTVTPGESIDAEIHVTGGSVEQEVRSIDLEVETRYAAEDGYSEMTIDKLRLTDGLTIEPDHDDVIPVTIDIPYTTPVTLGTVDVWVETELEIDMAVDPEDKDYLDVRPTPRMQAVFDAAEELGFTFRSAECEADPYGRYTSGRRFVQEFEFRPQSGPFAGKIDEIELVFVPSADELTVFLEVDRRGGLLSELADTDERKTRFSVRDENPSQVTEKLRQTIEKHA
jgi:sporulation-control protein